MQQSTIAPPATALNLSTMAMALKPLHPPDTLWVVCEADEGPRGRQVPTHSTVEPVDVVRTVLAAPLHAHDGKVCASTCFALAMTSCTSANSRGRGTHCRSGTGCSSDCGGDGCGCCSDARGSSSSGGGGGNGGNNTGVGCRRQGRGTPEPDQVDGCTDSLRTCARTCWRRQMVYWLDLHVCALGRDLNSGHRDGGNFSRTFSTSRCVHCSASSCLNMRVISDAPKPPSRHDMRCMM